MELEKGAKLQFKSYELQKALKVLVWSVASAMVVFLIALLDAADVPAGYVWLVPLANTLLYSLKELIADNTAE